MLLKPLNFILQNSSIIIPLFKMVLIFKIFPISGNIDPTYRIKRNIGPTYRIKRNIDPTYRIKRTIFTFIDFNSTLHSNF